MANEREWLLRDIAIINKILVLILCCSCAYFVSVHGLLFLYVSERSEIVVEMAIYGYIYVVGVMLLVYIFDKPQKLFESIVLTIGGVLSLVASILCVQAYHEYDTKRRLWWVGNMPGYHHHHPGYQPHANERLIVGVVALVNSIVMLFDGLLSALLAAKL